MRLSNVSNGYNISVIPVLTPANFSIIRFKDLTKFSLRLIIASIASTYCSSQFTASANADENSFYIASDKSLTLVNVSSDISLIFTTTLSI